MGPIFLVMIKNGFEIAGSRLVQPKQLPKNNPNNEKGSELMVPLKNINWNFLDISKNTFQMAGCNLVQPEKIPKIPTFAF